MMAELPKKRNHPKLSERWPVTVLTQEGEANGETRSLTVKGVFFHCLERLKEGEVCHMKIGLPEKPVVVTGELAWSNLENFKPEHIIPGMGFCFVKISQEDRDQFCDAITALSEKKTPMAGP
jgi:hypothetical protein